MIPTIESIIEDIHLREGDDYTNYPSDRGGPTKFGITLRRLMETNADADEETVKALTWADAEKIYTEKYVAEPGFDRIKDPYLMSLVIDCGVQHGVMRATQWLQQLCGVAEDGHLGPISSQAINSKDPKKLYYDLLGKRVEFYGGLIAHDPQLSKAHDAGIKLQAEYALGWARRIRQFIQEI